MGSVENAYKVIVVLDREYGEQLPELPDSVPVWVVDTPPNRAVAERLWAERRDESHLTGITTFKVQSGCSPDDILVGELGTIDLHHGEYSSQPPYSILEVIGTSLNDTIKAALAEFGFNEFQSCGTGFRATRPLPERDNRG